MHVINFLLQKTIIRTFKSARILLETTLSMTKQQHWCSHICNVIQSWILWINSLILINIVGIYHISVIFDIIGYTYTILVIVEAIHSDYIHTLYINGSGGFNLDATDPITLEIDVYGIIDYNLV